MGIYDRDYFRQPQRSGFSAHLPRTVVGTLIAINVAVWIVDQFTPVAYNYQGEVVGRWLSDRLAARPSTFVHPWLWWQFLTAGFTHAPANVGPGIWHVAGNMIVLFFLGPAVEDRYGPREFLRIYLSTLVFANIAWCFITLLTFGLNGPGIYGASGAIAGIVVLFAFNFPNVTILLFFVLPMPAWVAGTLVVLLDIYGAVKGGSEVAYVAHVCRRGFRRRLLSPPLESDEPDRWPARRFQVAVSSQAAFAGSQARRRVAASRFQRRGRSDPGKNLSRGRGEPDAWGAADLGTREPRISTERGGQQRKGQSAKERELRTSL